MKISIARFTPAPDPHSSTDEFTIPEGMTLLQALQYLKATTDPTLTFKSGCRSGICGTCAVRVNGREVLSCSHKVQEGDLVEPLQYHALQRDLIVDKRKAKETLKKATAWLHRSKPATITIEAEKRTETQSDCILCDSCYSACPVYLMALIIDSLS